MDLASCPWAGWAPPNLDWCEAELCGWIRNPSNTWSNLAYMIGAIPMWRGGGSRGRVFALASLFVGLTSFIYHASVTYFFQVGDFLGMFAFVGLPLSYNAVRLGWLAPRRASAGVLGVVVFGMALVLSARFVTFPIQSIVFVMIVTVIGQELVLAFVKRTPESRRLFWIAVVLLGAGALFSSLDLSRVFCDPNDHLLQGHAIWHVLGAVSLVVLARFYRNLDAQSDAPALSRQASVV